MKTSIKAEREIIGDNRSIGVIGAVLFLLIAGGGIFKEIPLAKAVYFTPIGLPAYGSSDGQFTSPNAVAMDASGNVFVADTGNDRIQKFDSNGKFISAWGAGIGFNSPMGIAVDAAGNVYVADTLSNNIKKFDNNGIYLTAFGSLGNADGQFDNPYGVAVDASGNIYVADTNNNRIQKLDSNGNMITKWTTPGFSHPQGIAVNAAGDIYVADTSNNVVKKRGATSGTWTTMGSYGFADGQFFAPQGINVDKWGNLFVTSNNYNSSPARIQKFDASGNFVFKWEGKDSTKPSGGMSYPGGLTSDSQGNIFVADTGNHRIQKFSNSGIFINEWYGTTSGISTGQFSGPKGVAADGNGKIYVADSLNHRIQRFDNIGNFDNVFWSNPFSSSGYPAGVAGPTGIAIDKSNNVFSVEHYLNRIIGFNQTGAVLRGPWGVYGTGAGAEFNQPNAIAIDKTYNEVYVADTNNNRIKKLNDFGIILWDTWGSLGTAVGKFDHPYGVAVDTNRNVFVTDTNNNRVQRRDVNTGNWTAWGSVGSGNGQFNQPTGIAVDTSGNVYVSDSLNGRVQKFSNNGTYLDQWGSAGSGNGQFNSPAGLTVDTNGDLFVADFSNNRLVKITMDSPQLISVEVSGSGTVTSSPAGINCGTTCSYSFNKGDSVILTATPAAGYKLDGWKCATSECSTTAGNIAIVANSAKTVTALFSKISFYKTCGIDNGTATGTTEGKFNRPSGVAMDASGNIYVADTGNNRIQKFNSSCVFVSAWGSGVQDGTNAPQVCTSGCRAGLDGAWMNAPMDIAVDSNGDILVTTMYDSADDPYDFFGNRIIKLRNSGTELARWGGKGTADGKFDNLLRISTDSANNVYAVDYSNKRIQKFGPTGNFITKWSIPISYVYPFGITLDSTNKVYVSENNDTVEMFSNTGSLTGQWGTITGTGNGKFSAPKAMTRDAGGNIYVADTGNKRIQKFNTSGTVLDTWYFESPSGIAATADGRIFVADSQNNRIRIIEPGFKLTVTKSGTGSGGVKSSSGGIDCGTTCDTIFQSGTSVTLTAKADGVNIVTGDAGSTFSGWSGACTGSALTCTVSMDAGKNVTANFTKNITYSVAVTVTGTGTVTSNPDGINCGFACGYMFAKNSSLTLKATPTVGSTFSGWGGTGCSGTTATCTINIDAAKNVSATFVRTQGNDLSVYSTFGTIENRGDLTNDPGYIKSGDGQFFGPYGVVSDSYGRIFVADSQNNRIQKLTNGGGFIATWGYGVKTNTNNYEICTENCTHGLFGGDQGISLGSSVPISGNGQFWQPSDIAVDSDNNIYVHNADTTIKKLDNEGNFIKSWTAADGTTLAVDKSNNLYATTSSAINKYDRDGNLLMVMGWGVKTGAVSYEKCTSSCQAGIKGTGNGQLSDPRDISTDFNENIYVADSSFGRIQKFDKNGNYISKITLQSGSGDGKFSSPTSFTMNSTGNYLIVDSNSRRIQELDGSGNFVRKLTSPPATNDKPTYISSITLDSAGNIIVSDFENNRIQRFDANTGGISTWGATVQGSGDGQIKEASGIKVDGSGNLLISDIGNERLLKTDSLFRQINIYGIGVNDSSPAYQTCTSNCKPATTINQGSIWCNSANQTDYEHFYPGQIALNAGGNVFVGNLFTNRVRNISTPKDYGTGVDDFYYQLIQNYPYCWATPPSTDGVGILSPRGVGVDSSGNVYVYDSRNFRVQKFDSAGTFISAWGMGINDGDMTYQVCTSGCEKGLNVMSASNSVGSLAIGASNNVYITDGYKVVKFDKDGNYLAMWTTGAPPSNYPVYLTSDSGGNIYVTNVAYCTGGIGCTETGARIQKFDANGVLLATWGNDGTGNGEFIQPGPIAVDSAGAIYVGEKNYYINGPRIQKIIPNGITIAQPPITPPTPPGPTPTPTTYVIGLSVTGSGTGTITGSNSAITCDPSCRLAVSPALTPNSLVVLTVTPSADSTFTGWSGACTGQNCTLTMDSSKTVTANFDLISPVTKNVTVIKTGSGRVVSTPAGIDCGTTCSYHFASGSSILLRAIPDSGYAFSSWTGCTSTNDVCTMTVNSDTTVTAKFTVITYNLTVTKPTAGNITGNGGLNCGTGGNNCTVTLNYGTSVSLTATPDSGYTAGAWSGVSCLNGAACAFTLTGDTTITHSFVQTFVLSATPPTGGTITGNGLNCGATCSSILNKGTTVTLSATPLTGYTFSSWGGDCSGMTCSFTLNASKSVTASFNLIPVTHTVTITKTGAGQGIVTSMPGGINCGASCNSAVSSPVSAGTKVRLFAAVGTGYTFTGWSGDCSGTAAYCDVTMNADKNVTVNFDNAAGGGPSGITGSCAGSGGPGGTFPNSAVCATFNGVNVNDMVQLGDNGEIWDMSKNSGGNDNPLRFTDAQGISSTAGDNGATAVKGLATGVNGSGGWFEGFKGIVGVGTGTGTGTNTGVYGTGTYGIYGLGEANGIGVLGEANDNTAIGGKFMDSTGVNNVELGTKDYSINATGDVRITGKLTVEDSVTLNGNVTMNNMDIKNAVLPNLQLIQSATDQTGANYSCQQVFYTEVKIPTLNCTATNSHTHTFSASGSASGTADPSTHVFTNVPVTVNGAITSSPLGESINCSTGAVTTLIKPNYICISRQI